MRLFNTVSAHCALPTDPTNLIVADDSIDLVGDVDVAKFAASVKGASDLDNAVSQQDLLQPIQIHVPPQQNPLELMQSPMLTPNSQAPATFAIDHVQQMYQEMVHKAYLR